MAVMCTSVVALLVQASVWPKVGAAKDTYQQLVAVQVTMTGTSTARSTSSRQQPEKTGGQRFGGWSVNHGIGGALVNDAAAAAIAFVVGSDDTPSAHRSNRPLARPSQRVAAKVGSRESGEGGSSSVLGNHADRNAAANSAGQRRRIERLSTARGKLVDGDGFPGLVAFVVVELAAFRLDPDRSTLHGLCVGRGSVWRVRTQSVVDAGE